MTTLASSSGPSDLSRGQSHDSAPEAGPSRPSRRSSHHARQRSSIISPQARPTSPDTALSSRQPTPPRPSTPHLDLATFPTPTLLRLLAELLQQIALANDQLRPDFEDLQNLEEEDRLASLSSTPGPDEDGASTKSSKASSGHHPSPTTALFADQSSVEPEYNYGPLFTASKTSLSYPSSLLSFHARHIPSITIEAYLLRILKYCPTTNEVFLGLLVYFDRMSRLGTPGGVGGESAGAKRGIGRGFAIDSYNIHRLVIAGVTVASKFFSDVFYTNSRYAKVGGLPPHELNQLELQFLLLNDFRLVIPIEEMQRYGDRLLGYSEARDAEVEMDTEGEEPKVKAGGSTLSNPNPSDGPAAAPSSKPDEDQADGEDNRDKAAQQSADDKMDVDLPAQSTEPSGSTGPPIPAPAGPPASAPPPSIAPTEPVSVAPRGKERDKAVNFAPPTDTALKSGLRDWVRNGDDVMGGVIGGRMTSPMRD